MRETKSDPRSERSQVIGMTYDLMEAWIRATPEQRRAVARALASTGVTTAEVADGMSAIGRALRGLP